MHTPNVALLDVSRGGVGCRQQRLRRLLLNRQKSSFGIVFAAPRNHGAGRNPDVDFDALPCNSPLGILSIE